MGTPEQLVERITYVIRNLADAAYGPASMDLFANAVTAAFA